MRKLGCLGNIVFAGLVVGVFGLSSYFSFRLFVRGKSIQAPDLVGHPLAEARAIASDAGLVLDVDNSKDRNADQIAVGSVAWQNRAPGNYVKRGSRLIVGQSLGPLVLQVPDLDGETPRTALLRFSQRNLKLGDISYVPRSGRGGIIAEDPAKGSIVDAGTGVSLLVAYAPPPPAYVMPDIIDQPFEAVRNIFQSYGLSITNVRYEAYPGIRDGTIIRQYPLNGAPVSGRDAITVVVSHEEQADILEGVTTP
ncbi:MAG: PASTA domain-containing protein [Acidobacteriota bacterium]